ncbi:NAD-binding protein [Gymnopilus junonius]|uniref:NAD-binding protein n=1 Tax=Gymnopilus junonius TaxID=109634 RepID=A0A9P5TLL3_GYMJU|nr:NAD-binding protein [Gymnopilus junonius]
MEHIAFDTHPSLDLDQVFKAMVNPTKIFMTGVTGFIGPAVLQRLLDHNEASQFHITAFLGVNTITGSLEDLVLTENLAADADIVIAMADADNLDVAKAVLRGMKRYHKASGTVPTLIHTSGTGVVADAASGDHASDIIYDDINADQIELCQRHNHTDMICQGVHHPPSMVYGLGSGRLLDLGVRNKFSIVFPQLIKAALVRGRSGVFGAGKNVWNNVHVDDIVDLYIILFDTIREKKAGLGHGREGYYFAENGEHSIYELGKAIGEGLVALGRATIAEPSAFTNAEIDFFFQGSTFWDRNSRARASRARSLGWHPVKTSKDMLDSIQKEIEAILESENKSQ